MLIEEHLERACGGDALGALVGAGQRGAGDEPVKQHERNEQNGEDSARALRDFFDHARHGGVNFFDPDKAERAPDEREHQVCAAVNVERRAAVIPRNGAEQHLLSPTAQILERRTDDAAGNKNDDVVLLVELIQAQRDDGCAAAVNGLEWAVHKADTQLNLVRDEERPAFFKHKTGKAADEEDPEEFCEVHAERKRAVFRVFECSFIFIAVALPAFGGALFALFRRDAVRF